MKKPKKKNWRKLGSVRAKKNKREKHHCCEMCGASENGRRLHVHHILSEGAYPEMSNQEDNLIVVCSMCHLFGKISFHGSPFEMVERFNEKFPGRYKELIKKAQTRKHCDYEKEYNNLSV
jgi:5-methylcytosine-specific restriction endonuclease McrA